MFNVAAEQRISLNKWKIKEEPGRFSIILTLIAGLLGLAVVLAATTTPVAAEVSAPLLVTVGAALLVITWRKWETGIQALLVVLIIEGAVRKWFLPSASELVYFYKDILMVAIVISYLRKGRRIPLLVKRELKVFSVIVIAFALYVVASISNPGLPHPLVGALGVKAYLLYVPLAYLGPRIFTSNEKLVAFLKWYVLIALFVGALSAMQFVNSDPDSALNRYAWDEKTTSATGMEMPVANFQDSVGSSYVRVTGSFSYLSGLAIYLPTMFALLLGLISQRSIRSLPKSFRWIYHLALGIVVTTSFMTGSRGAVLNLAVIALVFYGLASKRDLFRRLRQAAVGAVLIGLGLTTFFPQAFDALYTRALGGEDEMTEGRGRIDEVFHLPFDEAGYAGAFGYGVGATQNATPVMMSKLNLPFVGERIPIAYEAESGRVMLELGVCGYALHLLLRISILVTLLYACFSIQDVESKSLAVAALAALLFPLMIGGAVTQHTQNVYQWFLVGIPLAMLSAERMAQPNRVSPSGVISTKS
ncbi:MAG TPA: hypothetical protein VMS31_22465 [Pyrinomonadaceae bacterium]|nr:hypothetical protein [Pyrinomonadaceae bacterium]